VSKRLSKPNRNLKVVRSFGNKSVPYLPLKGRWLEQAGFAVGMRVDVIVVPDCLIIMPAKGPTRES
jgi:hypothetical protein